MMVFFRTRPGKILIWQKFSLTWESDFQILLKIYQKCIQTNKKAFVNLIEESGTGGVNTVTYLGNLEWFLFHIKLC